MDVLSPKRPRVYGSTEKPRRWLVNASNIAGEVCCDTALHLLASSDGLCGEAPVRDWLPKEARFIAVIDVLGVIQSNDFPDFNELLSNSGIVYRASFFVSRALLDIVPVLESVHPSVAEIWKRQAFVAGEFIP